MIKRAIRNLLKHPGFTTVAVITLALGIGANTAIFSVVNAVLLRPLPYQDANRLVMIWGNFQKLNIARLPAKPAEYNDYAGQSAIFEAVAAFDNQNFNLTGSDEPQRISATRVTPNLFSMLGAEPVIGRQFDAGENQAGREQVAVLSYGFWQRRFGGDRRVINQVLTLDDQTYTVIGVMPAGFQFPHPNFPSAQPAEVWIPLAYTSEQVLQRRGPYFLNVLARLKPGVTLVTARTEMNNLAQRFEREQRGYRGPNGEDGGWRITLIPLQDEIVGSSRRALFVLFGAVALVLLIACANVSNLLLLRAARRRKDLAIQSALGASSWRIVQQLLTEGLVLSTLGGVLGLLMARWSIDLLIALGPGNLPRTEEIGIDAPVLAFTGLTSILSSILFGLVPAMQASKLDLQATLKDGGRGALSGWHGQRWSNVLVVSEVALSLLLLISAGLLVNSFLRLQRVNPGIAVDQIMTAKINLSASRYREPAQASAFFNELAQRMGSLPGVQTATFSTVQVLSEAGSNDPFAIEGRPLNPDSLTSAGWQMVSVDYFKTLGVPLTRGRDFTLQDMDPGAPTVAVINEKMAARYWPNADPIGRRITLGLPRPDNPWVTIVGIAKDLPHGAKDSQPAPDWYVSRVPGAQLNRYLFVRTAGDLTSVANAIRNQVSAIDRNQPITTFQTMNEVIGGTIAPRRFNTLLLGIFAAIALVLAAIGTYSVISYSVASRTHEIGIRIALGARKSNVLKMVIKRGMTLALMGTLLGLCGAFALTRLMTSLLFDVSPTDPLTYFFVSLGSLAVALLACYIPARCATKVDPVVALRYD